MIIGLTGPSGSGKSEFSALLAQKGVVVVDCDQLAREVVCPGQPGLAAVVEAFGASFLNKDGSLNRKALGKAVFAKEEQTALLNQTLLPHILQLLTQKLAALPTKEGLVLLDAPTLYQSGADALCHKVVCLLATPALCATRIANRDGLEQEAVKQRLGAGLSPQAYAQKADLVLHNTGSQAQLQQLAEQAYGVFCGWQQAFAHKEGIC